MSFNLNEFEIQLSQAGSSTGLVQTLLGENSKLTERVASLNQEIVVLKHTLSNLENQLCRTENNLAKVTSETENRRITSDAVAAKVRRRS